MRISDWSSDVCSSDLAAPSSLHGAARLGADAGHGLFGRAVDAELGWHDQRADDAERRVGQDSHRPDHPHDGRRARFLWHGNFRGADAIGEGVQQPQPLYRMDGSEERRVGKEGVSKGKYRWAPYKKKKKHR